MPWETEVKQVEEEQLVENGLNPVSDDTAPSASLGHLEAQAAPTQLRARPEPLGSLQWPQELASGCPKVEDFSLPNHQEEFWAAIGEEGGNQ